MTGLSPALSRGGMLAEQPVEGYLDALGPTCQVLSRRRVGACTVQHLVVAPSGVWVIASRRSPGRPARPGGMLSRRIETLHLGRRAAARLVESVRKQADLVRAELAGTAPVGALLCILDADWPLFGGAFTVDGVRVLWPKKAGTVIKSGAKLSPAQVAQVAQQLDAAFPVAAEPPRSHRRRP